MSVKVDLAGLADQVDAYGFAYLLTVGDDLRAHAVAVRPVLAGGVLSVEGTGRRTRANLVSRPQVSLVWPPVEAGGYSLIVDVEASVTADGADLTPTHAVLHRPADPGAGAAGVRAGDRSGTGATDCGNDCVPVGESDPSGAR